MSDRAKRDATYVLPKARDTYICVPAIGPAPLTRLLYKEQAIQ